MWWNFRRRHQPPMPTTPGPTIPAPTRPPVQCDNFDNSGGVCPPCFNIFTLKGSWHPTDLHVSFWNRPVLRILRYVFFGRVSARLRGGVYSPPRLLGIYSLPRLSKMARLNTHPRLNMHPRQQMRNVLPIAKNAILHRLIYSYIIRRYAQARKFGLE